MAGDAVDLQIDDLYPYPGATRFKVLVFWISKKGRRPTMPKKFTDGDCNL